MTEEEHDRLAELKGDLSWAEFLTSLPDGGRYERKADARGRVSLPDEWAGRDVVVLVGEVDDE